MNMEMRLRSGTLWMEDQREQLDKWKATMGAELGLNGWSCCHICDSFVTKKVRIRHWNNYILGHHCEWTNKGKMKTKKGAVVKENPYAQRWRKIKEMFPEDSSSAVVEDLPEVVSSIPPQLSPFSGEEVESSVAPSLDITYEYLCDLSRCEICGMTVSKRFRHDHMQNHKKEREKFIHSVRHHCHGCKLIFPNSQQCAYHRRMFHFEPAEFVNDGNCCDDPPNEKQVEQINFYGPEQTEDTTVATLAPPEFILLAKEDSIVLEKVEVISPAKGMLPEGKPLSVEVEGDDLDGRNSPSAVVEEQISEYDQIDDENGAVANIKPFELSFAELMSQ